MEQFTSAVNTDDLDIYFESDNAVMWEGHSEQGPRSTASSQSYKTISVVNPHQKNFGLAKKDLITPQLVFTDLCDVVPRRRELDNNISPVTKRISKTEHTTFSRIKQSLCSSPVGENLKFDNLELLHSNSKKSWKRETHCKGDKNDVAYFCNETLHQPSSRSFPSEQTHHINKDERYSSLGSGTSPACSESKVESKSSILPQIFHKTPGKLSVLNATRFRASSDGSLPRLSSLTIADTITEARSQRRGSLIQTSSKLCSKLRGRSYTR